MLTSIGHGTEPEQVASIVRSLQARLASDIDTNAIAAEVEAELAAYSAARITQFVPIIVESRVRVRHCREPSV